MKLGSSKVFARAHSRAGEDKKGLENSSKTLRPLLPSAEAFCNAPNTLLNSRQSVIRSHCRNRRVTVDMAAFASRCFPKTIKIPAGLRDRPLQALSGPHRMNARLAHVLYRSGVHALGDLHGR